MKALILIIIFGKTIMLTPEYIDLEDSITLVPEENLAAITTGASLQIDVTKSITKRKGEEISDFRKKLTQLYPPYSIKASLIEENGDLINLTYSGGYLINNNKTLLSLSSGSGIPTDKEYSKVILKSDIPIKNVLVSWKNFKK